MREIFPDKNDKPLQDFYETRVFKSDRGGLIKDEERVWFKKRYEELEDATAGHKEAVELLAEGKLPLKEELLYPD